MSRYIFSLLLVFGLLGLAASYSYAETVLVKAGTLSLRKSPDTGAARIQTLRTHEPVRVLSRRGDWARVEATTSNEGWVLKSYLTHTPFVSVDVDSANLRQGPGTNYTVLWRVDRHFPLYVLDRSNGWLHVMDFDGDEFWISEKIVSFDRYVITQLSECNVRKGAGVDYELLFRAERGVILKVLDYKEGWMKVRHTDGEVGWISAKIVFGWFDAAYSHVGFPKKGPS